MKPGLYDELISLAQRASLELGDPRLAEIADVDPEESHLLIAQYLEHAIAGVLGRFRGKDVAEKQRVLADRIVDVVASELDDGELDDGEVDRLRLDSPLRRLLAIRRLANIESPAINRPDTPLNQSALLTGTRLDPSLGSQLSKEIATASRVDILCSFIKWSGLRIVLDSLRELTEREPSDDDGDKPRLRIITTSYMGATDPKAIEQLAALPRTEVRVSYDTERTRLHAKAYLIHRSTGFSSGGPSGSGITSISKSPTANARSPGVIGCSEGRIHDHNDTSGASRVRRDS